MYNIYQVAGCKLCLSVIIALILNSYDTLYAAVIMTRSLRVHPVHLINVEHCQVTASCHPSEQTNRLDLSVRLKASIIYTVVLSSQKLILILPSYVG